MKTLVIFDIDGTLLQSAGLHHDLISAILAADGLDVTFQPWGAYKHYTDLGVLDELYRHSRGRPIAADELARYDALYEEALQQHVAEHGLHEVAGAKALLASLAQRSDVAIAFATGSLRRMAKLKLSTLGIDTDHIALASGGEYLTREDIVRNAVRQAVGEESGSVRKVILGDGLWDQRTAANLGIPFVALETGTHVFADGPVLTLSDFIDLAPERLLDLATPVPLSASTPALPA